jgi:alpha-beta hydrolase superfamily lysophospholipase
MSRTSLGESPFVIEQLQSSDGTTIAVERSGRGDAVVLVDGAFGSRQWGPNVAMASRLAEHFTVFHYDRRGRGASGDTLPYHVVFELDDLATVIDATGGPAFVFGASSGGNLALRAAASGVPITKLAIWEPNTVVSDGRPPLPRDYLARLNKLVRGGARGDAVEYFMTTAVGLPADSVAPMRSQPVWAALEATAHTLAYDSAVVADAMSGDGSSFDQWSSLTTPTLVIDGGTTPALAEGADALAAALPNARRLTIAGQQHDVNAGPLAPVVLDYFTST